MSSISHTANSMLTPMGRLHASHSPGLSQTKQAQESNNFRLCLNSVIGTTTDSVNAFDALPEHHIFVCCAGSAAVLSRVDERLNITQQLFRVRPNASPVNATTSFYNAVTPPSTPAKSRYGSSSKDGGCGTIYNGVQEYHPKSPSHGKATNRSRETSCVSLSRRGDLVAVGERGYNPRVLIFSTASDSPSDVPCSILSDHSFGVASVAFSDNSRWLCTLGSTFDGFILIYSINAKTRVAKLHSSNKCSNVHRVIWMGDSVLSIGIRHAKVWRIHVSPAKKRLESDTIGTGSKSPTPKAFAGRNCLLGPLMDATFTSATAISDSRAVLCTAQGDICLLDDSHETQRLERVAHVDFGILCVVFDHVYRLIWIGGRHGNISSLHVDTLINPTTPTLPNVAVSALPSTGLDVMPDTIAIGFVRDRIITLDSLRIIEIRGLTDTARASVMDSNSRKLPAHESAVLGVSDLLPKSRVGAPDYFTFSARGTVLFWLLDGTCTGSMRIDLDQPFYPEDGDTNDLKIVVPLGSDEHLLSGDRMGVLRLIDWSTDEQAIVQAHSGDINSIAVANPEGMTIVATCGRDRTLQLFRQHELHLDLLQTLDDHTAAVGDVKFLGESTLLSISSDRTIIVRKLARSEGQSIAFFSMRIITLKASPVSLTAVHAEPSVVLVSTLDRQILRYNVSSGRLLHSFKASDPTTGDSLLISSLEVHEFNHTTTVSRLILGVSPSDKSIRVHEYNSGVMLTREYGQNGVSAMKLLRSNGEGECPREHLVSCGLDGTVMTWTLVCNLLKSKHSYDTPQSVESPSRQSLAYVQPLRRALSKAELTDLQKSLASESHTVTPIRGSPLSRVRRKGPRYGMAAEPKISPLVRLYRTGTSLSPADTRFSSQPSQGHSPSLSGENISLRSKSKPSSLDCQRRSKSAANLNDLNDLGEQICISLRTLRSRIGLSSIGKLEHATFLELSKELNLTTHALDDKATRKYVGNNTSSSNFINQYPATSVDDGLSKKARSEEITFEESPRGAVKSVEERNDPHAGEDERFIVSA